MFVGSLSFNLVNRTIGSAYLAPFLGYADTEYVVENVTIFVPPRIGD